VGRGAASRDFQGATDGEDFRRGERDGEDCVLVPDLVPVHRVALNILRDFLDRKSRV